MFILRSDKDRRKNYFRFRSNTKEPLDSSGKWSLVVAKIDHEILIPCKQKKLKLKFFFSLNFVSANSMDGNFGVSAPLNGLLGPVCLFDELLQPNHVHILSGAGEHLLASLH